MRIRFENGSVVLASGVVPAADIVLEAEQIRAIEAPAGQAHGQCVDLRGGWLLPGFIDTQVNGGGGALFNDASSVESIRRIGEAHAQFGTSAFLPTLISDTPEKIAMALAAVDEAIDTGVPGVAGIHIEGPFINEIKRGIHEKRYLRRPDERIMELLCTPRRARVMVTLAPELWEPEQIRRLTAHGVIVSIGHTDGSYEEVTAAIQAGATGFTHLFNAMSRLAHRAPGAVGAALDANSVWCGLIVDNAHLHPAITRIAVRAKGIERIMLVSDAMPCVGSEETSFMLQGKRIEVRDGICTYADGTLAGTALDMASAVRNTVAVTGLTVPEAAMMASASPARFLGLQESHGAIDVGMRADWAWLDDELRPKGTWIGGQQVSLASGAAAQLCEA